MEIEKLNDEIVTIAGTKDSAALYSFLGTFKDSIEVLEKDYTREEIINRIDKIRHVFSESQLIHRAQHWPKGYQGDFETIKHIISQQNLSAPDTTGYEIENFFLQSPICKQHVNKVKRQAGLISAALTANSACRILSIGCGTSEDLKLNIDKIAGSKAEITLVDADQDALDYSFNSLVSIKEHIRIVQGNIYKIIRRIDDHFDLVIIGGVFDYLSDKVIVHVLSALKERLNKGGTIYFSNIKKNNPFRIYMEYLSDWILIERSEPEILSLLEKSGFKDYPVTIQTDDTNLTYLVEISKQ